MQKFHFLYRVGRWLSREVLKYWCISIYFILVFSFHWCHINFEMLFYRLDNSKTVLMFGSCWLFAKMNLGPSKFNKIVFGRTYLFYIFLINICILFLQQRSSWSWSYNSWIYNYLCNKCLLPLKLGGRLPCTRYNIMRYSLSVTVVSLNTRIFNNEF